MPPALFALPSHVYNLGTSLVENVLVLTDQFEYLNSDTECNLRKMKEIHFWRYFPMEESSSEITPLKKRTIIQPLQITKRRQSVRLTRNQSSNVDVGDVDVGDVDVADENENDDEMETESGSMSMKYFNEDSDMPGHQIYSFKTPKKKDGMIGMAYNTPKTPKLLSSNSFGTPTSSKTPRTPKTPRCSQKFTEAKTPSHQRSRIKKGLKRTCRDNDEDDEYFDDSADEYDPSSESEVDSDEEKTSSSEEDVPSVAVKRSVPMPTHSRNLRNSTNKQQDVIFESDKYFGQTSRKNATSDNTLDSLKTPRLQHEELFKLLNSIETSTNHQQCIQEMQNQYETLFSKWLFILNEGYNIILYGLGSKRNILQRLHSNQLAKENVLVVNGYFPSLTLKEILDNIVIDFLDTTCKSKHLHEIVDAIEEGMNLTPEYHIFLIIHNLEGAMLRNEMAQNVLSRLAHIPNIHLIASIDHINTPHLWDNIQLSNYNFSWWDVTSFMPYTDETSVVENSMLVKNSGTLAISSMKSVFLSITSNARGIYMIIVKNQLANSKSPNFQGMSFKNLYQKCLEEFLVSSDIVLRTQLTEFFDHKLLKLKRTADGTEHLKIPIDNILLQQFVEQQNN